MTTPPDPDQQAVYYAEEIAFGGTSFAKPLSESGFLQVAAQLFGGDWWARNRIPVPIIEPTPDEEAPSCAEAVYSTGQSFIRIAPTQIDAWTLAHEAAHVAQFYFYSPVYSPDIEAHGREFRACYLNVAEILMGGDWTGYLRQEFKRRFPTNPEHTVLTVPPVDPVADVDPKGLGVYRRWKSRQEIGELEGLRQRIGSVIAF